MSVRVLGLDLSTFAGFAFWETSRHISTITADVFELPPSKTYFDHKSKKKKHDYHWDDWRVAQVGPKTVNLLRQFQPDIVLIEERMRFSKAGDGGAAMSNAIHGAVYGACCAMNKLFGTVNSQAWRPRVYGEGFTPPLLPDLDRYGVQKTDPETGAKKFKEKDWGDIAVEKCELLKIKLPPKKSISHNAAEAALIAMVWRCHNIVAIPETRAHQTYMELRNRRKDDVDGAVEQRRVA